MYVYIYTFVCVSSSSGNESNNCNIVDVVSPKSTCWMAVVVLLSSCATWKIFSSQEEKSKWLSSLEEWQHSNWNYGCSRIFPWSFPGIPFLNFNFLTLAFMLPMLRVDFYPLWTIVSFCRVFLSLFHAIKYSLLVWSLKLLTLLFSFSVSFYK